MKNRQNRIRRLIRPLVAPIQFLPPSIPLDWVYISLITAFLAMIILGRGYETVYFPSSARQPWLNSLTFILDPMAIQLSLAALIAWLTYRYLSRVTVGASSRSLQVFFWFVSFSWIILLLAFLTLVEKVALENVFFYENIGDPLGEPWLASIVDEVEGAVSTFLLSLSGRHPADLVSRNLDVPSGDTMRQVFLFYLTVWITSQRDFLAKARVSSRVRIIVHLANVVALSWVIFSRIYRGEHSVFGVAVGIGVATILFWTLLTGLYTVSPRYHSQYRSIFLRDLGGATFVFSFMFYYYSNHAGRWLVYSVVIVSFFLILSVLPPLWKNRGNPQRHD